jgi:hypothetical protein
MVSLEEHKTGTKLTSRGLVTLPPLIVSGRFASLFRVTEGPQIVCGLARFGCCRENSAVVLLQELYPLSM